MENPLYYEKLAQANGAKKIVGIDEAGRGPLAGPLVVAGVVMPLDEEQLIVGIDDSKKLSAKKRDALFDKIVHTAESYHVAIVGWQEIDELNILNATKKGMIECVNSLAEADFALIDAVKLDLAIPSLSIIHGDALSYSVAAASIVAKVTRDRLMEQYDKQFPQYRFAKHKGYGTAEHIALLKQFGPCPIHRKTFITHFVTL